jgi:hypothetical protein
MGLTKPPEVPCVFEASDFDPGGPPADDGQELCTYRWAAERANAKLAKMLGPRVFGGPEFWNVEQADVDTHSAHLFNITPLAKVECEHEPVLIAASFGGGLYHCGKCKVKMKQTWTVSDV